VTGSLGGGGLLGEGWRRPSSELDDLVNVQSQGGGVGCGYGQQATPALPGCYSGGGSGSLEQEFTLANNNNNNRIGERAGEIVGNPGKSKLAIVEEIRGEFYSA
jgi:hypothetical protein